MPMPGTGGKLAPSTLAHGKPALGKPAPGKPAPNKPAPGKFAPGKAVGKPAPIPRPGSVVKLPPGRPEATLRLEGKLIPPVCEDQGCPRFGGPLV